MIRREKREEIREEEKKEADERYSIFHTKKLTPIRE